DDDREPQAVPRHAATRAIHRVEDARRGGQEASERGTVAYRMSVRSIPAVEPEPAEAVLYAVLDDVRNTLGLAWLDPIFRGIATDPIFVIAAWAATRPNITKSFTESASRLRKVALQHVNDSLGPPDHRDFARDRLGVEDADRLIRTVRALYHGLPKVYLVVQSWARLARRQ